MDFARWNFGRLTMDQRISSCVMQLDVSISITTVVTVYFPSGKLVKEP
jgi:hypothetical protein